MLKFVIVTVFNTLSHYVKVWFMHTTSCNLVHLTFPLIESSNTYSLSELMSHTESFDKGIKMLIFFFQKKR